MAPLDRQDPRDQLARPGQSDQRVRRGSLGQLAPLVILVLLGQPALTAPLGPQVLLDQQVRQALQA
jgi:hypothetical protein